jgi:hypothetical protein
MDIVGRDGVSLNELWDREGTNAHLGIMVSGFPNLFLLLGPNTGLGHNSVVFMIESQIRFVLNKLRLVDAAGARQVDVRQEAQRSSARDVQGQLADSVWMSGCHSWYLDEHGRNITIWPRTTMRYWFETRRMRRRDYTLVSGGTHPRERSNRVRRAT